MNEITLPDVEKALIDESVSETLGEQIMKNKQYPKFQLSKFLAGGRDYQVVIRTDDANELIQAMKELKPLVDGIENKKGGTPDGIESQYPERATCPEHNVTIYRNKSKYTDGDPFFYSHKLEDGRYCNKKAKDI